MGVNTRVGGFGENVAVKFVENLGYVVLGRNWRCDAGELDIVALDGDTVVVCEVKTRSSLGFGSGLEAVTREKAARLRRLAWRWIDDNGWAGSAWRIDVIAIHPGPVGPEVEHVPGAC